MLTKSLTFNAHDIHTYNNIRRKNNHIYIIFSASGISSSQILCLQSLYSILQKLYQCQDHQNFHPDQFSAFKILKYRNILLRIDLLCANIKLSTNL